MYVPPEKNINIQLCEFGILVEQVRDKINLELFFPVCSCRLCIALPP